MCERNDDIIQLIDLWPQFQFDCEKTIY